MKKSLKAFGIILTVIIIGFLWLMWEIGKFKNPNFEFGYYGRFNRVKNILDDMPNVQITNDWQHHDVTLEDFGFSLVVNGTNEVHVNFWENSPQMKLRNKTHIRDFIEEIIKGKSNQ